MSVVYFAYGSNMSSRRLQARVPSARAIGIGELMAHRLQWHMHGPDGSAKCDIGADATDSVWGVLYRFDEAERWHLDLAEGHGVHYTSRQVTIQTPGGIVQALTYQALLLGQGLTPYEWYREYVVRGALEHGLPPPYVRRLEAVAALTDPDTERNALNDAILGR